MRRVPKAAVGLILLVGCTQRYVVDVTEIEGCDDFDWNGRVIVTESWKGFFGGGHTVDLIKLESRDGRSILIDATGCGVEAYVEVEVKRLRQKGDGITRSSNAARQ